MVKTEPISTEITAEEPEQNSKNCNKNKKNNKKKLQNRTWSRLNRLAQK